MSFKDHLSHLLFQASLSPLLRSALLSDPAGCQHESACLMLPDTDSRALDNFLSKVSLGQNEVAETDPSLAYLEFSRGPIAPVVAPIGPIVKIEDLSDYDQEVFNEVRKKL